MTSEVVFAAVLVNLTWIMGLLAYSYGWFFIIPYFLIGLGCSIFAFWIFISLGDKNGFLTTREKLTLFRKSKDEHVFCALFLLSIFFLWPFVILSIFATNKGWIKH